MKRNRFSLVEVVVAIVILGILAVIAIPKLLGNSEERRLQTTLDLLRNQIQVYKTEHYSYPEGDKLAEQLTMYTSADGSVSEKKEGQYRFGPYLLSFPPCPVGDQTNPTAVEVISDNIHVVESDVGGWVYDPNSGSINANTNLVDPKGKPYSHY